MSIEHHNLLRACKLMCVPTTQICSGNKFGMRVRPLSRRHSNLFREQIWRACSSSRHPNLFREQIWYACASSIEATLKFVPGTNLARVFIKSTPKFVPGTNLVCVCVLYRGDTQICSGNKFGVRLHQVDAQICSGNKFGMRMCPPSRRHKLVPGTNLLCVLTRCCHVLYLYSKNNFIEVQACSKNKTEVHW
jgi:hypothetical protein